MSKEDRKFLVITGMSGAGRSSALKCLEDLGFFCVDNLPISLLPEFVELYQKSRHRLRQVALGIDIREGPFVQELSAALEKLKRQGLRYRVIFLDAEDHVLVQRFSETRRKHPLGKSVQEAIAEERRHLKDLKAMADKVIETSGLTLGELKERISSALEIQRVKEMNLAVISFGYKHGLPLDADLVLDVRFLPNPNYVASLKPLTGKTARVRRYVMRHPVARRFLGLLTKLLSELLPLYIKEGKSYLTVAIGCTGGKHRSVVIANAIAQVLQKQGYPVKAIHRDIERVSGG